MGVNFPNDEIFLTTEEVLEYLQVNLRTVYRLIKAGKIPAVRVGRQWRFRKRDIDAWLDTQRPRGERSPSDDVRSAAGARWPQPGPGGRTTSRAFANCCRKLWRLRNTMSIRRRTVAQRSSGCASGNYDLLIADLKMPGMDGLTLIREAKRLKADLPVIIITGFSTESSAIEAVNLGVAGYLTKPFRVPQVLAAAARALGE